MLANLYLHRRSREEAEAALSDIRGWVEEMDSDCTRDQNAPRRRSASRRRFSRLPIRGGRLVRLKDAIRTKTRRTRLAQVIAGLNPMLRGWFGYFKHAHPITFQMLDGFVRRRLRALLRKHEKRPGFGRCHADHQRWPNAFFAQAGLFALHTARLAAKHSR